MQELVVGRCPEHPLFDATPCSRCGTFGCRKCLVESLCAPCRELTERELRPEQTAGFGPRAAARMIDSIARLAVTFIAGGFTAGMLGVALGLHLLPSGWHLEWQQTTLSRLLMGLTISLGGPSLVTFISGASVGKVLLSLRVVTRVGAPVTLGGAFLREVGYLADVFLFGLVGKAAMARSPLNQRLGDVLAGTVVVRASSRPFRPVGDTVLLVLLGMLCEGVLVMLVFATSGLRV